MRNARGGNRGGIEPARDPIMGRVRHPRDFLQDQRNLLPKNDHRLNQQNENLGRKKRKKNTKIMSEQTTAGKSRLRGASSFTGGTSTAAAYISTVVVHTYSIVVELYNDSNVRLPASFSSILRVCSQAMARGEEEENFPPVLIPPGASSSRRIALHAVLTLLRRSIHNECCTVHGCGRENRRQRVNSLSLSRSDSAADVKNHQNGEVEEKKKKKKDVWRGRGPLSAYDDENR